MNPMTMGDNNAIIHEGNKFSNCSSSTTTLSPRNSDLITNHTNNNLWLFTIHSLHDVALDGDGDDDGDGDGDGDGGDDDDVVKRNLGPKNDDGNDVKCDLRAMDDDDDDDDDEKHPKSGGIAMDCEAPGNKSNHREKPGVVAHFDDLMTADKPRLPINVVLDKPHKSQDQGWASIRALRRRLGPEIPLGIGHFKLLERVGHGDIGTVFLAQLRGTSHCFFAIKVMDKESLSHRKKLERMHREREILGFLDHPFLPTLYAHFEAEKFSCLVMDFCPGGDLHALRQKQPAKRFGLKAARFYAAEVLLALEYLHMLGIVYRDLKPENVLVREDGHIMLTDFDLSLKCEVEPKLSRCPLSASSSTSGRFSQFMRSFSVSSSVASSLPSTPIVGHTSLDCMVGPASCTIHPFLSCLPISGTASALTRIKARQSRAKHRKSLFSMLFNAKQVGFSLKSKASSRTPRAGEVRASKDMMDLSSSDSMNSNNVECIGVKDGAKATMDRLRHDMVLDGSNMSVDIGMEEDVMMRASNVCRDEIPMGVELIAEPTEARSMSFVGTHEYLAPEMIDGRGHGNAVDWWTFGIFLYELLYGKTPFKGAKNEHTLLNIVKQPLRFPEWGGHVDPGEHAKTLIEGLLEKLPSQRLGSIKGAAEIKQHPFFRGVNWALIRSADPPEVPNFGGSRLSAQYYHHHHQQQQQQQYQQDDLKTKVFTRTPSKAASHFDYF